MKDEIQVVGGDQVPGAVEGPMQERYGKGRWGAARGSSWACGVGGDDAVWTRPGLPHRPLREQDPS